MSKFAKLFDITKYGQILVKLDSGDEGPEVRVFFQPEGLGVCSLAMQFKDSDEGWDRADEAFDRLDLSAAERMVGAALPEDVWESLRQ